MAQIYQSHNHTKGIPSFDITSHGHNHVLLSYLSATTDRTRAGNHCYESYTVTLGGVPKYEHSS